jgi:hypothetical protein
MDAPVPPEIALAFTVTCWPTSTALAEVTDTEGNGLTVMFSVPVPVPESESVTSTQYVDVALGDMTR